MGWERKNGRAAEALEDVAEALRRGHIRAVDLTEAEGAVLVKWIPAPPEQQQEQAPWNADGPVRCPAGTPDCVGTQADQIRDTGPRDRCGVCRRPVVQGVRDG